MSLPAKCVSTRVGSRIVVKENGRALVLQNPDRRPVDVIRVDGCAITQGERCDYLMLACGVELYIELKGSDIKKAVVQIRESIAKLAEKEKALRCAAIVSSRVPAEDTSTMLAKRDLIKSYVSKLYIKNTQLELAELDLA